MKAKKVLKRISKIEALMSRVTERSSASAPHIQELIRDAKAAVIRAKEAVQASLETPKTPSEHPPKATPNSSKPKRRLSAAGRKAISAANKKRWAAKRAAAKQEPAIAKKAFIKKGAVKKVVAKKAPATKVTVKAPTKKTARAVQAAKKPSPPKAEGTTGETVTEQAVPEAPVQ
jgi:hypothetical protein